MCVCVFAHILKCCHFEPLQRFIYYMIIAFSRWSKCFHVYVCLMWVRSEYSGGLYLLTPYIRACCFVHSVFWTLLFYLIWKYIAEPFPHLNFVAHRFVCTDKDRGKTVQKWLSSWSSHSMLCSDCTRGKTAAHFWGAGFSVWRVDCGGGWFEEEEGPCVCWPWLCLTLLLFPSVQQHIFSV